MTATSILLRELLEGYPIFYPCHRFMRHHVQVFADVKSHLDLTPRIDTRLSLRKLDADQGAGRTSRVLVGPWPGRAELFETCVTWLPCVPIAWKCRLALTPPQPPPPLTLPRLVATGNSVLSFSALVLYGVAR